MNVFLLLIIIFLIRSILKVTKQKNQLTEEFNVLKRSSEELERSSDALKRSSNELKNTFDSYKEATEHLRKYEEIRDVEKEKTRIENEAAGILNEANNEAIEIKKIARAEAKQIKEKAVKTVEDAYELANKIEANAQEKAEEIAGDALQAKNNASRFEETAKAMKNIIKGYGDEYLIPNHSLLDKLAEEYSHKEAGEELAKIRKLIKAMIKNGEAADCDYVELNRKTTAIDFVLDAFNGKIDTIMAKVRHDNYGKLLQALKDAFSIVNYNGKPFRNARIKDRYYKVIEEQLKLAVTVQELKKEDREEQKRIREEMREEERARREYEKSTQRNRERRKNAC